MRDDSARPRRGVVGPSARLAAWLAMLAGAMLLLPAPGLAQPGGTPNGNPRLASLNIEIWPEFDRPAALVILRAGLAESVALPANVTLRLPIASGGPTALAHSATAEGNLLNLTSERVTAGEFITLKFVTPERFFHVEFYEPIVNGAPARSFRYVWPGDLAVDQIRVVIQEPATASDVSVEPNLDGAATGQDGLHYRAADLGPREAGKELPITVRYTKGDTRTTSEILKPKAVDAAPAPAAPVASAPAAANLPNWAYPFAGLVMFGLAGAALILWWWRRESGAATAKDPACTQCGAALTPGHRFCGNCGAKVVRE